MVDTNYESTAGQTAVERASRVVAGPITFTVEYRRVVQAGVEVSGPTIRVVGADDDHEYLRFDMFNSNAHYHYTSPSTDADGEAERVVVLDTVTEGEPVSWAISRLRGRLAPMLANAGGQRLVELLDEDTLGQAVDEVAVLIRAAEARVAPA
jgi:hypothetical protein